MRSPLVFAAAVLCIAATAAAAAPSAQEPLAATPTLRRALDEERPEYAILVGLREPPPATGARRDVREESRAFAGRLERERRLAASVAEGELRGARFHASFPAFSARASRRAVLELARRPEVAWVDLDGRKRLLQSAAQAAQQLIGSDLANHAGLTGAGFSIAVVDTGVDYDIASLGGPGLPNSRVVGGIDTADGDGDPRDCDGHGTSVAGIASAVAPGAGIVAVKVFRSANAASNGCQLDGGEVLAFDSDILEGIDYAVTNRSRYSIAAINLSLGSPLDGDAPVGWCDARSPAYAAAFEAAAAAGIAVIVASGNEGLEQAVDQPACVSSAVSVGAVYAAGRPDAFWGICLDAPVSPDDVACFSNSSTTLSLLAPGTYWSVDTKGGVRQAFSGTSAAAPAVSGAVALARQARPGAGAAEITALLRSSGRSLEDRRNGVRVPRLDVLRAVQTPPSGLAVYAGPPIAVPSGGPAFATALLSGWTGAFAGIRASVAIDHPDASRLTVSLRGPDGTSVLLHDGEGVAGPGINAVYGATHAPVQSLHAFSGRSPNGLWILSAQDRVAGGGGRIRSFSVQIVTGPAPSAMPAGTAGRVVPVAAHVQGTRLFQSDLRLYNPGPDPRALLLYYVAAGGSSASAPMFARTVAPHTVLALDDVVLSEYGLTDSIGGMALVCGDEGFLASSRAYSQSEAGSFGMRIPSFRLSEGLSAGGGSAVANGLTKTAQIHSNVGFTEVSGSPATVRMDIVSPAGAVIGSRVGSAGPNAMFLITDVLADLGLPETPSFRVDFTVTSPAGRVIPFATSVDRVTGDGLFHAAAVPELSADDRIVTQAAHVTGANGDFFETNLTITNVDTMPVTVTASLIPQQLTGPPPAPRSWTLAPGETRELPDVLSSEFGLSDPSAAAIRLHPSGASRLVVSARTFVRKAGGSFGYFVASAASAQALGAGAGIATALQIDHAGTSGAFRSNFGFAEVAGQPVSVIVTVRAGATGHAVGGGIFSVAAGELFQGSVSSLLPRTQGEIHNAYLQFEVVSGAGRILPYATVVDNRSGDAIYVPAERP